MPDNESPELKRALDQGSGGELPPNVPPGLLGDRGLNVSKRDGEGSHGLNAGLTDEWDGPVVWLLVVLLYFVFFPLAFYVLWRSKVLPRRTKVGGTVAMATGLVLLALWLGLGAPRLPELPSAGSRAGVAATATAPAGRPGAVPPTSATPSAGVPATRPDVAPSGAPSP